MQSSTKSTLLHGIALWAATSDPMSHMKPSTSSTSTWARLLFCCSSLVNSFFCIDIIKFQKYVCLPLFDLSISAISLGIRITAES